MSLSELSKVLRSHVSVIVVGAGDKRNKVYEALRQADVATLGNPDIREFSFSELKVDDVRDDILPFASFKPLGERKYIIVSFSKANDASQNALLKAVEDSLGRTVFIFIVESVGHVIPTLRSRCLTVRVAGEKGSESDAETDASSFMVAPYEERLKTVEKMASYITKSQDRTLLREFLNALLKAGRNRRLTPQHLRDILDATGYVRMQGTSPKAVLGHLAVTLPHVR